MDKGLDVARITLVPRLDSMGILLLVDSIAEYSNFPVIRSWVGTSLKSTLSRRIFSISLLRSFMSVSLSVPQPLHIYVSCSLYQTVRQFILYFYRTTFPETRHVQFNKQTLNKVIGTRGSSADVSIIHRHVVHLVKIKICRTSNFSCWTFRGKKS